MSQSLFDLSGRVAVVTGGTTGIGHAIALGLAQAGADVVCQFAAGEQVEKVAAEIEALGRQVAAGDERCARPEFTAEAARCGDEAVRQGRHPGERGGRDVQGSDARDSRKRSGRG